MFLVNYFTGYSNAGTNSAIASEVDDKEKKDVLIENEANKGDNIDTSIRESDTDWDLLLNGDTLITVKVLIEDEIENPTLPPSASSDLDTTSQGELDATPKIILNEDVTGNPTLPPSVSSDLDTTSQAQMTPPPKIIPYNELSDQQKELLSKLETNPNDYDACCDLAATLSEKVQIQIGGENLDRKWIYLKASKIDPKKQKAYFQLVLLLDKEDKIAYGALEKALMKVIGINPHHIKAFELLGKHFDNFTLVDGAIKLKDGTIMTKDDIFNKITELKRERPSHQIKV